MPKTYTLTAQVTVGDELASAGEQLIEHRLSNALEFNTDDPAYDLTIDQLTVAETREI